MQELTKYAVCYHFAKSKMKTVDEGIPANERDVNRSTRRKNSGREQNPEALAKNSSRETQRPRVYTSGERKNRAPISERPFETKWDRVYPYPILFKRTCKPSSVPPQICFRPLSGTFANLSAGAMVIYLARGLLRGSSDLTRPDTDVFCSRSEQLLIPQISRVKSGPI